MKHQSSSSLGRIQPKDTVLKTLGKPTLDNPALKVKFRLSNRRILYYPFHSSKKEESDYQTSFAVAGAAEKTFFDPINVKAGIVTCGGICPGLNDVIRSITLALYYNYGARKVFGFRYGFQGLIPSYKHETIELTPETVSNIHDTGGTILGTSRGVQDIPTIVDTLDRLSINQLYITGGDGTLKAAHLIQLEIEKRNLKIAVVGIPKTIDNDIDYVSESYGFNTAVEVATNAIRCAHVEALSSPNGIGLVKLMGRHSGFIAATAAIAQRDVNFILIPEKKFELDGPKGFLKFLHERLLNKGHAVIVVAEGAGQDFFEKGNIDQYGHLKLSDIGVYMKNRINEYFQKEGVEVNLKYIDPSYIIRSGPSNTYDGLFAATLAQNAVHGAMAGYTDMLVSTWHGVYCYIPLELVTKESKTIDLKGRLWLSVLESTGQSDFINDGDTEDS